MISRAKQGFTVVELIVVIVVIGILITVAGFSYREYQKQSRDETRSSNAKIIAEALEKYRTTNGEYPICSGLEANPTGVLKNTPAGVFLTPKAPESATESIYCDSISNTQDDVYAYVCTTGVVSCVSWTLSYRQEVTGSVEVINSRYSS